MRDASSTIAPGHLKDFDWKVQVSRQPQTPTIPRVANITRKRAGKGHQGEIIRAGNPHALILILIGLAVHSLMTHFLMLAVLAGDVVER